MSLLNSDDPFGGVNDIQGNIVLGDVEMRPMTSTPQVSHLEGSAAGID